jgi:TolB-like protein/DNA-binding winged helix-turn-helix (wHTH) protein
MRLTFDDYILDVARRELWRGCQPVVVEPQVFDLLAYLVQHPERVVTKDELLQAVWDGRIVSESAITNRVNAARRAIGDSGEKQHLIRTVPRKGFRFIGAIKKEADEPIREAVPQGFRRRRGIALPFTAAVSGLLGAAIAVFLLWPGAGHPWVSAVAMHSAPRPITASAGDLRLPVAVLPLTALGNSTDQPNLAASLTEDLTTELSRGGLLVTSRATTSAYFGKAVDAAQVGRELGVRYIVDGSVEQAGSQIRVTARLADAETGAYFWADRYDRATGNVLDLQDEILGRIVNSIRRALVMREADRPGEISNAARLIWRGSALLYGAASRQTDAEAARLFERALEIAPDLVLAKIRLANALALSAHGPFHTYYDIDGVRRARDVIDSALAAAPNSAAAHYSKAQVLRVQGDCQDAIGEYEMTIALDRNVTGAYALLGYCKLMTGAIGDVVPLEERAMRLDPMGLFDGGYYQRIGMAELFQSHLDQAVSLFEKARTGHAARQSEWVYQAHSWLAAAYALNGDTSRAADALAEARKFSEYPASIAQYRRQVDWLINPNVAAWADSTYFKGLRLAGLPEE